jgi:hypothetical protein
MAWSWSAVVRSRTTAEAAGPAVMDDERRPGTDRGTDTCVLKEMSEEPPQRVGQRLQAAPDVVGGLLGVQQENPIVVAHRLGFGAGSTEQPIQQRALPGAGDPAQHHDRVPRVPQLREQVSPQIL